MGHDLGAEKAHQPAPLDAELFGHGHHQRVAFGSTHHCESDAGITTCRLDDRLSRLEFARLLGGLDHTQRQSVFNRAQWVEGLDLDEQVDTGWRQPVDPHHGCISDGLQDVLKFCHELLRRDSKWVILVNAGIA